MTWRPQSFAQLAKTMKDDPDGTGQAIDQTFQYLSGQIAERQAAQGSGITGNRPANASVGWMYFDTTLNIPCWWNGHNWVNSSGVVV